MEKDTGVDLLDASVWDEDTLDATVTPDAPAPQSSSLDYLDSSVWDEAPAAPEMAEQDGLGLGDIANDAASAFGIGAGSFAQGIGWLADKLGAEDAGEAFNAIGQSAVGYWRNNLSDEAKAEMEKEFVTVKEGGKWYNPADWSRPEDAAGVYAAFLMGMESLPATVTGMGIGGKIGSAIWKVASKTKTVGALGKVAETGQKALARGASLTNPVVKAGKRAERIQKWGARAAGAVGYGAGEAIPAAGMAGFQVEEDVLARNHDDLMQKSDMYPELFEATANLGMDFEERVEYAKEQLADMASSRAGMEAGLATFALGAPMGALSAPLFNKAVPWAFKGGKVRGGIVEGFGEAGQEFAQSGTEAYISNLAVRDYADRTMDVSKDVVNQAVGGAVSGAGMGAAFGVAGTPTATQRAAQEQSEEAAQKEKDDVIKVTAFAETAVAGLTEIHGMSPEEAQRTITPILTSYFDDRNVVRAVSDLRHLEKYGRLRERGVDDQARVTGEEFGLQQEASRNGIDYYMIPTSVGADGGRLDALKPQGAEGTGIYVIEQTKADGSFDEHKVVFGVASEEEAVATYQRYYRGFDDEQDRNVGSVTAMNEEEFKGWVSGTTAENAENLDTQTVLQEQEAEQAALQGQQADEELPTGAVEPAGETMEVEGGAEAETAAQKGEVIAAEETGGSAQEPVTAEDVSRETQEGEEPLIVTDTNVKRAKQEAGVAEQDKEQKFTGQEKTVTVDTDTAKAKNRAIDIRYSLSPTGNKATQGRPYVYDKKKQEYVKNKDYVKPGTDKWADNYLKLVEEGDTKPVLALGYEAANERVRGVLKTLQKGDAEQAKKEYASLKKTERNIMQSDTLWAIATKAGLTVDKKGRAKPTREQLKSAIEEWAGIKPYNEGRPPPATKGIKRGNEAGIGLPQGQGATGYVGTKSRWSAEKKYVPPRVRKAKKPQSHSDVHDLLVLRNGKYMDKNQFSNTFNNSEVADIWLALGVDLDKVDPEGRSSQTALPHILEELNGKQLPLFSLSEKETKYPWSVKTSGEGQLYVTRVGSNVGTVHKTRQGPNDLAITFDETQIVPDYAYYLLQYLKPQLSQRAGGSFQQAIKKGDIDEVLADYFKSKTRYSVKELGRRVKARGRMTEMNQERSQRSGHLVKTYMRKDWTQLEEDVDASTAGAFTRDEIQEAVIDWIMRGTKSKYFQRWFGESQTVDQWGEPIRFYHGSGDNIDQFVAGKRGFVSVTTNPEIAALFATYFSEAPGKSPTIYPLYVKAEKVFDFRNKSMRRSLMRFLRDRYPDAAIDSWYKPKIQTGSWLGLEDEKVQEFLKERGYDAFWMREDGQDGLNLGVLNPENIKSAVGNAGTFSADVAGPINYSLSSRDHVDVFTSAIEQWVDQKVQERNVDLKKLRKSFDNNDTLSNKGLKKEEVDDLQLLEWIDKKIEEGKTNVPKNEVLDFIRMSKVDLYEIETRTSTLSVSQLHGGIGIENAEKQVERVHEHVRQMLIDTQQENVDELMEDFISVGTDALTDVLTARGIGEVQAMMHQAQLDLWQAKYYVQQQQLPPKDYRDEVRVGRTKYHYIGLYSGNTAYGQHIEPPPTYREFLIRVPRQKVAGSDFISQHWEDENTLMHMRLWGQFDSETGQSTLIIEEIQSDWHQQGSRYGYGDERPAVPQGPMPQSWRLASMKRMIRYAVDNGYDEVAWTTGDIQQDRYDLSKLYRKVELQKTAEDKYKLTVHTHSGVSQTLTQHPETGEPMNRVVLGRAIGEELADKMVANLDSQGYTQLEGDEVRWEAVGVKAFYDYANKQSLKNLTDKYLKRFKARVKPKEHKIKNLITGQMESYVLWTFPITEKLQSFVTNNPQTLYSLSNSVQAEVARRIELMQIADYVSRFTNANTKSRVLRRRLIAGMESGFYSKEALRYAGLLKGNLTRDKMLIRLAKLHQGQYIASRTSLPARIIRQELRRLTSGWTEDWVVRDPTNMRADYMVPTAIVHDTVDTLPPYMLGNAKEWGVAHRIEGVVDPLNRNIIHIVAANIGSMETLQRVFTEEAIGHHGLSRFFGPKFQDLLEEVLPSVEGTAQWDNLLAEYPHLYEPIQAANDEVKQARKQRRDPNQRVMQWGHQHKLAAVEELIAKEDVEQSVWEKVISWIRDFLRNRGFNISYTDNDFRRIMRRSAEAVMQGKRPHAWGRANHVPAYSDGINQYSLVYSGIFESQLYNAVKEKVKQNDTAFNILNRLRGGSAEQDGWFMQTKSSAAAAGKMGFKETELLMSGVVQWLVQQYQADPKTKISPQQLLDVIEKTAPVVQFIGRQGHMKFPPHHLSSLIYVQSVSTQRDFDRDRARREMHMVSDKVSELLNDHTAIKRLALTYSGGSQQALIDQELTPYNLSKYGELDYSSNVANLPRMSDAAESGQYSEEQLAQMFGLQNIHEPISPENSNALIRSWLSNMLIMRAANEVTEYSVNTVMPKIKIHGLVNSPMDGYQIKYGLNDKGQVSFINEVIEPYTEGAKYRSHSRFLLQYLQTRVDRLNKELEDSGESIDSQQTQHKIETWIKDYVSQRLEEINSEKDIGDLTPDDILPELPATSQALLNQLQATFAHHRPEFLTSAVEPSLYDRGSTYSSYMMQNGDYPEVVSVQLHGQGLTSESISGEETVPPRDHHFHYGEYSPQNGGRREVLHVRLKVRTVKGTHFPEHMNLDPEQDYKILAIEEVQSDWASYFKSRAPKKQEVNAWVDKYHETFWNAWNEAREAWGFQVVGMQDSYFVTESQQSEPLEYLKQNLKYIQGYGASQYYGVQKLEKSTLFSKAFELALRELNPELSRELAAAKRAWKELPPDVQSMPWIDNYAELALKTIVGFARQSEEFKAVTFPESLNAAIQYGGYIGARVTHYGVDVKKMTLIGYDKGDEPPLMGDVSNQTTEHQATANDIVMASTHMHDKYDTWNLDHLRDALELKNERVTGAVERLWEFTQQYYKDVVDDPLEAMQKYKEKVRDDADLYWDEARGTVLFDLDGNRPLYNSRLHRMLYDQLLPRIAGKLVRDTKAMKKEGVSGAGVLFVESMKDNNLPGRNQTRRQTTSRQMERFAKYTNKDGWVDRIDEDWSLLMDQTKDVRVLTTNMALHGRSGEKIRDQLAANLFQYSNYPVNILGEESRPYRLYFESVQPIGNADLGAGRDDAWLSLWPNNREGDYQNWTKKEIRAETITVTHATDHDGMAPWGGTLGLYHYNEDGTDGAFLGQYPWQDYDDGSMERLNYSGYTGSDPVSTTLLMNFGYEMMRFWGIDNPNPAAVPMNFWADYHNQLRPDLRNILGADYDYRQWIRLMNDVGQSADAGGHNVSKAVKWLGESNHFVPPEVDLLDHAQELEYSAPIQPPENILAWMRENAVIKNKADAAVVAALLSQSNTEKNRLIDGIVSNQFEDAPEEIAGIIPTEYTGKEIEQEQTEPEPPPVYNKDNPEFAEQVQRAVFITDRVRDEIPFPLPFSLRGSKEEHQLVDSKIERAQTAQSVPQRVSTWLHNMNNMRASGDMLWSMKQGILDDAASVERWEKEIMGGIQDASVSPYKAMHMTKNLPSVMAAIAKVGIPEMRDGVFQPVTGRKGFIEILRPLYEHPEGDLLRLWEGYAAARRANELIDQQNPDGTDREKLFTREEIDELLALGEKYPAFKTVFDEWTTFNNQLLNLAVKHGVLSAAERDAWSENAYVPFYRAMEDIENVGKRTGIGNIKAGVEGQHPRIKRLYGSTKKLNSVVENMWYNTATLIDKVYKNEAMTRVVDMLDGIAMQEVDMPWEAVRVTNAQIASALKSAGVLTGDAEAQVRAMSTEQKLRWNNIFRRVRPTAENVVSVMRDGRLRYYEVGDEMLLRTLKGMQADGLIGLMKLMGLSKSILTRMITIDPGFMLANWMRDTLSAWVTSDANFVPVKDSIASMGSVFKEDGSFVKMMMSGAGGGGFYDLTGGNVTAALNDELGKGAGAWLSKAWKGYMKLGAASENSNRLAIANRIMQKGGTTAEAMYQAQDIMNFTMSGDYQAVRFLIRTVPFLNARMQGLYRLYRGAKDHPVGFMLKGASLMFASLALLARNWDDDDYEETEGWMKDTYWNFYVDGMHYSIPKPFEVGLLFATIPERVVRSILGRDDLPTSKESMARAFGETLAFNPIPQLFKPMYELGANKNLFTGNPIVNLSMQGLEDKYQASPWTSPMANMIGQAMPDWSGPFQSPLRIQHTIRAYTGTVGLYTLNAVDWLVRQADGSLPQMPNKHWWERPVISRVVKGNTELTKYNKYEEKLYDTIAESDKAQRTFNMLAKQQRYDEAKEFARKRMPLVNTMIDPETGRPLKGSEMGEGQVRKALNEVRQQLREVNEASRAIINNKNMDAQEKRNRLDDLTKSKNRMLKQAGVMLERIQELKGEMRP